MRIEAEQLDIADSEIDMIVLGVQGRVNWCKLLWVWMHGVLRTRESLRG